MGAQILNELKELKLLLAQLIGTSELPAKQQFSKDAIKKAAAEFKKLSIERGEWIQESDVYRFIRKAPWSCGKFIIEKFGFSNYFIRGRSFYFNRKDLIPLKAELKKQNINLKK